VVLLEQLGGHQFPPFSKTFGIRFPERLERSSKAMQRYKKSRILKQMRDDILS